MRIVVALTAAGKHIPRQIRLWGTRVIDVMIALGPKGAPETVKGSHTVLAWRNCM